MRFVYVFRKFAKVTGPRITKKTFESVFVFDVFAHAFDDNVRTRRVNAEIFSSSFAPIAIRMPAGRALDGIATRKVSQPCAVTITMQSPLSRAELSSNFQFVLVDSSTFHFLFLNSRPFRRRLARAMPFHPLRSLWTLARAPPQGAGHLWRYPPRS
jgi:hypothetical protein